MLQAGLDLRMSLGHEVRLHLSIHHLDLYYSSDYLIFSILAPTMYIFFASALPVIAFGEQLSKDTGRHSFPLDRYDCPHRYL